MLEDRSLPAPVTVAFQNGTGGYNDAFEVHIVNTTPTTNTIPTGTSNQTRFIDATTDTTLDSAHEQELLRFDKLFVSQGGPIPDGAVILGAALKVMTATTAESSASDSGGPIVVSQMLVPFDSTTTWNSLNLVPVTGIEDRAGPTYGIQSMWPIGSFRNSLITTGSLLSLPDAASANPTSADVTQAVQNWALNPANNLGFNIRAGTDNGWQMRTISHATITDRPQLIVTYDDGVVPANSKIATFQQGLDGYYGTDSAWIQMNGITTDGSTISGVTNAFLDGNLSDGSADDQMLIRFNDIFGNGPGQIPAGSTIVSAAFELSTRGRTENGSSQSHGSYAASQVLVDWNTSTLYTDTTPWGGDGPTHSKSKTTSLPTIGDTTSELKVLSLASGMAADSVARFDVTAAVQDWLATPANNKGLNVQAAATSDGWLVHFPGSSSITARPKLIVRYSPPAVTEPVNTTIDITGGTLLLRGGDTIANNLSVELTSGTYKLSDSSGVIDLTQAAKDLGWAGSGTNTITGPASSITTGFAINTGTGVDTVTIKGLDRRLLLDTGGQTGDAVGIDGSLTTGGNDFVILNTDTITATTGSLIDAGATGFVELSASNAVGTSGNPISTKAFAIGIRAGNGGAYVSEADGAYLGADVTGTGTLTVTNGTGLLSVAPHETVRTESGAITLTSGDALSIDGHLGITAKSGSGLITLNANSDGDGTDTYSQDTRGMVVTAGSVTLNVNTALGGTGDALLGITGIGGTFTVNSFGGNILWNSVFTITPDAASATNTTSPASTSANSYVFTTTGPDTSIGTEFRPIQSANLATSDGSGKSTASFSSGSGGIYFTDWSPVDLTVTSATATGDGNIRLATGNAGSATTSTGINTSILWIDGTVKTDTGSIELRSNDDINLTTNAVVGGAGFSGTITLNANLDLNHEQRITFAGNALIQTSNAFSNAVILNATCTDQSVTTSTIGGITLGNITVGDGGTITVNVDATASNAGNIRALSGTVLNAGSGKVILSARSRLLTDNVTPAGGAGIGTSALPVTVTAANVVITGTNHPVFVTGTGTTSFAANVFGRLVPANTPAVVPDATLNLATTTGQLILSKAAQTDGGTISLTSTGAGGGVVINAALGDANTGNITIDAGTNGIVFNTSYTVQAGTTTTFISGTPVNLGISTTNNGTIVANNGIEVGSGEILAGNGAYSSNVSVLANGLFSPAATLTALAPTQNLSVAKNGSLAINVNTTTPGSGHDQVNVTGTVNITDGSLRLLVGGAVALNDEFVILTNDDVDAVVGQFVGGTTIRGFNNPLVTFTVNYAGGDGNDIVAKVTDINPASALLDVQGNQVIYFSNVGINNAVTLTKGVSNFTVTEAAPGAKISLTQAAKDALWTGDGTSVVTGPHTGVAGMNFGLSDGADSFAGIDAGTANITITGTGTVTMNGAATTTGSFAVDEYTAFTLAGTVSAGTGASFTGLSPLTLSGAGSLTTAAGNISFNRSGDLTISGPTLSAAAGTINIIGVATSITTLGDFVASTPTLNVTGSNDIISSGVVSASGNAVVSALNSITNGGGRFDAVTLTLSAPTIGASGAPVSTKATTIDATSTSGTYVSEADGATVTAKSTSTGEVNVASITGTLILAGTTTTGSGLITLSSGDGVQLDGTIGGAGFSGRVAITANTDGLGSQGFTHSVGGIIQTTNPDNGGTALAIDVNTAGGGTGDAILGVSTVGATAGGTIVVNSNKGSILWNSGYGTVSGGTLPNPVGGSNPNIMQARNFTLTTAADGGSIGTFETPLQTGTFGTDTTQDNNKAILTAGNGGIYLSDWIASDLTIASASATKGDIQLFSANAAGSNLFVSGTVFTGQGNIFIATDDDLYLDGATIGGPTYAGTILLMANRDSGNEQRIRMNGLGSVETTNTGANAITMLVTASDGSASTATIGGVTLGNVKSGDGGTITIDAAASETHFGNIRQLVGTRVDAGNDGTIKLAAKSKLNGSNPAAGSGIFYDLDGTGANTGPIQVFAKNVIVTATNTVTRVAEGSLTYLDSNGFNLTAEHIGVGSAEYTSENGAITIAGTTVNDGADLTVTAKGTGGGIAVNAPLGDSNTGNITLDAGINEINFTVNFTTPANKTVTLIETDLNVDGPTKLGPVTTLSAGSTLVATAVGLTGTLQGTGTLTGSVTAAVGSTVSPGLAGPGILSTGDFTSSGNYAIDLNGTAPGSFDQVKVTGAVSLTNVRPVINVFGTFVVGDKFVVIDNDDVDPLGGNFSPNTNITAVNDPRYFFSSSVGGDGNDLVLTVTKVLGTLVHVTPGKVVQFSSAPGINNNLTIDVISGNYVINDTKTTIALTTAALAAGWTGDGTNTVTGPTASTTGLNVSLSDGTDSLTKLVAVMPTTVSGLGATTFGTGNVTGTLDVSILNTLDLQNAFAASGNVTVTSVTSITAGATGSLQGNSISITASNAIGTLANPVNTQGSVLALTGGAGGIYVAEADGASVSASATGDISITNASATLTTTGPVSTTGNISLASMGALTIDSTIGGPTFPGTITLAANTDGTGADDYTQTLVGNLYTTNTTANAVSVKVNTVSGTGNAILGTATVGGILGGTYDVQANSGNVIWNNGFVLPPSPDGGANNDVIFARDYTISGAGIGTAANPIQLDAFAFVENAAGGNSLLLTAGNGGAYAWEWGGGDLSLAGASATGTGNIQVVAANAAGNNIFVTGNVSAVNGNIEILGNDDYYVGPGVVIGGPSHTGTIYLSGNRDKGTAGQPLKFDPTSSVLTSNTSATAVVIEQFGDAGTPSPVTLTNVTVGNGGTITVNASPEGEAGVITTVPGAKLDAGATGTVNLTARLTTGGGNVIGTNSDPIYTVAGTASFTALTGTVWITDADSVNVSGSHAGTTGNVNLTALTGSLTVSAPLESNGATINLTADDIIVSNTLGDSDTGAMNLNGALGGGGSIVTGSGDVSITQATASTFSGVLSGSKNVVKAGVGTLTLSGSSDITGNFSTAAGTTSVTGSLTAASASTAGSGTLGGTGTIAGTVNTGGKMSPGVAGAGTLSTGGMTFSSGGVLELDLLGVGIGQADSVNVTGSVTLSSGSLSLNVPNPITLGSKFTVIANDNADAVTGTFTGIPEGGSVYGGGQGFTVSYVGGDGNDIVLTRTDIAPVVTGFVVNDGDTQRSRLTKVVVNFANAIDLALLSVPGAVFFTRTGVPTNNVEPLGTVVDMNNGLLIAPASGVGTSITLTFANIDNTGIDFGSLSDGRWQLSIPSASYTSPNGPSDTQLRRLFGNFDNDTSVDGTDFGFYPPFGAAVNSPFDYNNDGAVLADDFSEFGNRFGYTLL